MGNYQRVSVCAQRLRLMAAYEAAMSLYFTTLNALDLARSTVSVDEYKRMAGYVEQRRQGSDMALFALDKHMQEHHCGDQAAAQAAVAV